MKILLHDDTPAYLCHGGKQVLAQKIYENLKLLNVDVDYARWWDPSQKCDLLHLFNCSSTMVAMAHEAGVKVIVTHIVDRLTNLSRTKRFGRQLLSYAIRNTLPTRLFQRFWWSMLSQVDALVYINQYEAKAAIDVYGVPRDKTHVILHGYDDDQKEQLQSGPRNACSHLVSLASIVPRKNTIRLAKAARDVGVPVVFIGKPFSEENAYYREFLKLVDDKHVIYVGYASEEEKIKWLTEASGFVLVSEAESGCIAVYEAAAVGLPMLLSGRPWAYSYGKHPAIQYVEPSDDFAIAARLKSFYLTSQRLNIETFPVVTWREIAQQYIAVYRSVLASPAPCKGD
ncbi:MAG: glycosyltransferase family 4 protein [Sedimentisphaerales bacterium]|nr:glycosyltransferase family 4 protein [Sedimentisphaerales bacterium]